MNRMVFRIAGIVVLLAAGCTSPKEEEQTPLSAKEVAVTVGVKNFRQLQASLSQAFGLPAPSAATSQIVGNSQSRLPADTFAEKTSPASVLATVSVAAGYCSDFIAQEALTVPSKRKVHARVNFSGGPEKFTEELKLEVINNYAKTLWLRPATQAESQILLGLMSDLVADSAKKKRHVWEMLLGVCTAVAGSPDFIRI